MHLKPLVTLLALALLSACSSEEDAPSPAADSAPTPAIVTPTPVPAANATLNSAHQENGLPPVIEQF
jgi:uncharacterized lipoprotein